MKKILMQGMSLALLSAIAFDGKAQGDPRGDARNRVDPYGYIYGGAVNVSQQMYKGYETRNMVIPFIGYRGQRLQVFGPFVSYDLIKRQGWSFSANLAPRFAGYEESDSDTFIGMQERKSSIDVGLGARYEWNDLRLTASAMRDALGKSDGSEVSLALGKVFRFGPVFVEPSIKISYQDQSLVDYYYGVGTTEANAQRAAYQGKASTNSGLGLTIMTPIFFQGMTRLSLNFNQYDDGISQSPLVDGDFGISSMLIFSKKF